MSNEINQNAATVTTAPVAEAPASQLSPELISYIQTQVSGKLAAREAELAQKHAAEKAALEQRIADLQTKPAVAAAVAAAAPVAPAVPVTTALVAPAAPANQNVVLSDRVKAMIGDEILATFAQKVDKAKDAKAISLAYFDTHEDAVKRLLAAKGIDEKPIKYVHIDSDVLLYGGIALGVGVLAAGVTVAVLSYNKGNEDGMLSMVDTKVSFDVHGGGRRAA